MFSDTAGRWGMARTRMVRDDEIVEAVRRADMPFVTTQETRAQLADMVEEERLLGRQQLTTRLKRLREEGRVRGRTAGRPWIWWLPERVD